MTVPANAGQATVPHAVNESMKMYEQQRNRLSVLHKGAQDRKPSSLHAVHG
jgi:hypothetical protein